MSWINYIIFFIIICGTMEVTESANILVVSPMPSFSHFHSFQLLWENLIERGHNLTLISGFKLNDKFQSTYTLVDIKPVFSKLKTDRAKVAKMNLVQFRLLAQNTVLNYFEEVLKFPDVQTLISSNNEYDLVIAEMFHFDAIFAFGYKFNAPVMAFKISSPLNPEYSWIFGNSISASHSSNMDLPFTEKMSLLARIQNIAFNLFAVLLHEFDTLPRSQTQIEKYFHFTKENVPHIKDIVQNISVILENSHYSFGYIKPDLPNIVGVAGIHLSPPSTLPESIQKFLDGAEHGFIYVSFGSIIGPYQAGSIGKTLIRAMENLPQRVIMKWDVNQLSNIPENFMVQEWLPQISILHHSKCRLFISHGGVHSIFESLNASVPLIGIPFFGDQAHKIAMVEYFEVGKMINIQDISKELPSKISEILHNPKYKKNMEIRSQLFRERLNTPMDTALYWVDHVLKHKNTSYLKSASTQLTWYEFYSLDVLTILVASFWIAMKMVQFIIRKITQKLTSLKDVLFAKSKSRQKEKDNNTKKCD